MVLANSTRGIDGYYLEKSKIKNIPSVCITHGTLAPAFDKFDKIYKNIIAETATSNKSKYFAWLIDLGYPSNIKLSLF